MEVRDAENNRYGTLASANPSRDSGLNSGFPAWLLWLVVHVAALTGFKNRLSVLSNWGIAFFSQGRPQRVATAQQVFGRYAFEASRRSTSFGSNRYVRRLGHHGI